MARPPTTVKNGVKPAKNEIVGIWTKAKPAKIQAKNKVAT